MKSIDKLLKHMPNHMMTTILDQRKINYLGNIKSVADRKKSFKGKLYLIKKQKKIV